MSNCKKQGRFAESAGCLVNTGGSTSLQGFSIPLTCGGSFGGGEERKKEDILFCFVFLCVCCVVVFFGNFYQEACLLISREMKVTSFFLTGLPCVEKVMPPTPKECSAGNWKQTWEDSKSRPCFPHLPPTTPSIKTLSSHQY